MICFTHNELMNTLNQDTILGRYYGWWNIHAQQATRTHSQLLEMRRIDLKRLADLIGQQIYVCQQGNNIQSQVLFDLNDLQEFASGSIVKCFGQDFAIYTGRRSPRIPNGDFLLMSRITGIQGQRGQFDQVSSINAEYDIPDNAWYFDGQADGELPCSIYLEIALQPCGFLSGYLGTQLRNTEIDYFFRNLDGQILFTRRVDVRNKTIQTNAKLFETVFSSDTIIQHFSFELICEGDIFLQGKSTFGYFPSETMASQAGLDGGRPSFPWYQKGEKQVNLKPLQVDETNIGENLPKGKLRLIDSVIVDKAGGTNNSGYIFAKHLNSANDWYYACHFYQDPVMPGSLGIEAIIQAIKFFAQQQYKGRVKALFPISYEMKWKYRGQVLPHHQQMQLEVHFHNKDESTGNTKLLIGDANLWADDLRIYEISNIAIEIQEG